MKKVRLVATDLDGTFLRDDQSISNENIKALDELGKRNIYRVVATGRNLQKVTEVIPNEVPFDYVVYSSGAGVYNWKEQRHIFQRNIEKHIANKLIRFFLEKDYNFYAFAAAPNNHNLWFHRGANNCEEFNLYFSYHNSVSSPLPASGVLNTDICQFMLIIKENDSIFNLVKNEIEQQSNDIRVIRSSSPLTKGYIWVEIFQKYVSKASGVKYICDLLNVKQHETCGIGNDYNDLDLLNFTEHSFLAENAPNQIKNSFGIVPSNQQNAFAHAVMPILKQRFL